MAKYSKYVFYDDNGEKFTTDNAEFEEEEKELTARAIFLIQIRKFRPIIHFMIRDLTMKIIISKSFECFTEHTDEDVQENNMPNSLNNANLEILRTNPLYERTCYIKNYHLNPIPFNSSLGNCTDEDVQENAVDSS
ncbi:hypothetical protein TNCV_3434131 [Trichonephila clavipes]|nr:hypothetical protein TNCV_3434131 [Trichonephila clavipes]